MKDGAAYAPGHEAGDHQQARRGQDDLRVGDSAQGHVGGGMGDDDLGIAETNERDEQANARRRAVLQAVGNAVHNHLADVGEGEQKEEHAGDENHAERRLPWHSTPNDDGVGEVGIQRHAGRQGDGIVGP